MVETASDGPFDSSGRAGPSRSSRTGDGEAPRDSVAGDEDGPGGTSSEPGESKNWPRRRPGQSDAGKLWSWRRRAVEDGALRVQILGTETRVVQMLAGECGNAGAPYSVPVHRTFEPSAIVTELPALG